MFLFFSFSGLWSLNQSLFVRRRVMESRICMLLFYSTMAATLFAHCDARKPVGVVKDSKQSRSSSVIKHSKKLELMSKLMSLVTEQPTDTSNSQPYGVSSPFTVPPFDSLPPVNSPPYCVYPPNTPINPPPSGTTLSPPYPIYNYPPFLPGQSPPSSGRTFPSPPAFTVTPSPPQAMPTPTGYIPIPSGPILSPPSYIPSPVGFNPSPSGPILSPPTYVPSPVGFNPSPPVFFPPVVYPPPTVPPPPKVTPSTTLWCVAKPSVPDPIIEEAMNYACGSGADCDSIQPSGSCFKPDTLFAHASYAFNSYWQKTKVAGGTCEFGGTAILVTVDPSYEGCRFEYH